MDNTSPVSARANPAPGAPYTKPASGCGEPTGGLGTPKSCPPAGMVTAVPMVPFRSLVARMSATCRATVPNAKPRTLIDDGPGFEISTTSCPSAENSDTTTLPTWSAGAAGVQPAGRQTWSGPQFTSTSDV